MLSDVQNPYLPPGEHDGSNVVKFPRTSRLKFFKVLGLILATSTVVTVIAANTHSFSPLVGLAFFGMTVAGPFMTLSLLFWGPGPLDVPIWSVSAFIVILTFCYLIRPNKISFAISLLGAIAWASVAPILLLVFPELQIRI